MPLVVDLSRDRIILVRITLAMSIAEILRNSPETTNMFG